MVANAINMTRSRARQANVPSNRVRTRGTGIEGCIIGERSSTRHVQDGHARHSPVIKDVAEGAKRDTKRGKLTASAAAASDDFAPCVVACRCVSCSRDQLRDTVPRRVTPDALFHRSLYSISECRGLSQQSETIQGPGGNVSRSTGANSSSCGVTHGRVPTRMCLRWCAARPATPSDARGLLTAFAAVDQPPPWRDATLARLFGVNHRSIMYRSRTASAAFHRRLTVGAHTQGDARFARQGYGRGGLQGKLPPTPPRRADGHRRPLISDAADKNRCFALSPHVEATAGDLRQLHAMCPETRIRVMAADSIDIAAGPKLLVELAPVVTCLRGRSTARVTGKDAPRNPLFRCSGTRKIDTDSTAAWQRQT
ncbi:hypothetical protein CMUS01_08970 [Colletotrichum musicola]|uniref:Uncharacterized protein n=1 Tax=Colletotrichum musicola TaxID=2175873 RepID=A0A8H6KA30_9PEZI|nr:hypothetical protein CMUS01_08970 [Colletotrichum musicola]